jgi:drug/metabolite transporter (DMT)-like permease
VTRKPLVGYAMVLVAATLFGINGTVSKVALSSGLSSLRLTEARSAGACIGLVLIALLRKPSSLRVARRELPRLAIFGCIGVAFVQLTYFLAIHRLAIAIALLIQYLGPLLVAIYARVFGHEHVRRRIWAALGLSLAGLTLMVQLWNGVALDGLGVLYAFLGALAYATYLLLAEREVASRDTISLMAWGFGFSTLFWTVVQPWWSFPGRVVAHTVSLQGSLSGVPSAGLGARPLGGRARDDRPVLADRRRPPPRLCDACRGDGDARARRRDRRRLGLAPGSALAGPARRRRRRARRHRLGTDRTMISPKRGTDSLRI